ncbi:AMP-binding protein [Trinickia sp. LjRoot230]|uniref:AMP-binding protein n=1 Tax=Trinickia sp. LjRoot230 TaxID=3342288 RepID=UPI003F509AE3
MELSTAYSVRAREPYTRSEYSWGVGNFLINAAHYHETTKIHFVSQNGSDDESVMSYRDLLDEAQRIQGGLRAHQCQLGSNVALLLERAEDFIPAFWACVLGGYVPCPLVPIRNDADRWAAHLKHIDALLDQPILVTTRALKRELPGPLFTVELDVLRNNAPGQSVHIAEPEDPAMLMLTSGSTGNSKAVVLTHGNLLASMVGKAERQCLSAGDVTLNWISFDHVAALLEAHMLPLYIGASQIHVESAAIVADPLLFLRLIDQHRVSMTFAPNFLFGQINAALQSPGSGADGVLERSCDLSCVRHIVSGGEAIVVDTAQRFLDLLAPYGLAGAAVWPAFGMTETCAGSIYSCTFPDSDAGREFADLGRPIRGLQMRVVDESGIVLPDGCAGELQLHGPMIFTHYYNNAEATRAAFTSDGWFRTGDLGHIEDGRLSLVGRSKDSIIVNGVNYFSHELETVLEGLDGIEKSFVAAFPTRQSGDLTEQLVVTFAVTFPIEDEKSLYRLLTVVRNTTILMWGFRPAVILPLPKNEFPKTSLGKIQRNLLRKRFEAGQFAAEQSYVEGVTQRELGGHVAPEGVLEQQVAQIYAQLFNVAPESISATASFFDLGGTSLDILKLKRLVESQLALNELSVLTILRSPTVRALAASVAAGECTAPATYDPIVPLQLSGDKTPLFCVHPGVGEILVFINLAKYFVNERPFYALRARGFNPGEKPFESFDEMVRTYVEAIRQRQARGPYAIAGYSYGAAVAFEIAKMLESQGERVSFVGSFNLPPHIKYRMDELDPIESAVNLAFFLSMIDKEQAHTLPAQLRAEAPEQDPLAYLVSIAPPDRLTELQIDLEKFRAWAALAQSLIELGRSYVPSGAVESMSIFYAIPLRGSKEDWLNLQLRQWDSFSRSPNHYIDVPGEHYTLMGAKHVGTFQALLRAELKRTLGE